MLYTEYMGRINEIELAAEARRKQDAFDMRVRQSLSYRQIAEHFGVSVNVILEWVKEARAWLLPIEEADEVRLHEADKIDRDENLTLQMLEMVG